MKKLNWVLCMVACLFALSGCSILAETKPVDQNTTEQLESIAQTVIEGAYAQLTAEDAAQFVAEGPEYVELIFEQAMGIKVDGQAMINAFDSWNRAAEEIGGYVETTQFRAVSNTKGTEVVVTADVVGEKRTAQVEFIFKNDLYHTITSSATNVDYTFGEKMQKAGLNTLMGMGTVFFVLILLAIIISCFGFIQKFQNAADKKKALETKSVDNVVAQIAEKEELADDLELVAVITAAIYAANAASGAGSDDFVVRSIKRVSSNKWKKA